MGVFDSLSQEQYQRLKNDPRYYARNLWRHPNDPERKYDFRTTNTDEKINYLLHDDGPLNPDAWGNINVLKFARGCLKSTTMRMISNWALHMYPNVEIYMTAPRETQITNLTDDLQKNIRESGLKNRQIKDNQQFKKFEVARENDDGTESIYTAKFEADSGWGEGDALRGPHSHIGIIDEFQDIDKAAFDTFMQCIDQELPGVEYFPAIFIIGTPKLKNDFYHDLWQQTDQKEWDQEARTYEAQSEAATYTPSADMVEDMGLDPDNLEEYTVRGWHVDQYNSPLHKPQAIARDKVNLSEKKFQNEILANFYSPEDNLLATRHIKEHLFDEQRSLSDFDAPHVEGSVVTLGADWGGGSDKNAADTVIMVAEHVQEGGDVSSTILDVQFLDDALTASEEVQRVEEQIIKYDVDRAVVDYGHGYKKFEDLQEGVGTLDSDGYTDTVKAAKFGNISNKSEIKWEQSSGQRRFFTCDKSHAIQSTVDAVKNGQFSLPADGLTADAEGSMGRKIINHLTAPYKDYVNTASGKKKIRVQKDDNRNDDAMDALTYNWLAYHKVGARTMTATVAMNKRAGY